MPSEKKPTWVTVVAIIAIIFSSFGILGGAQEIVTPQMTEFQKKMFTDMTEEVRQQIENSPQPANPADRQAQEFLLKWFGMFESLLNFPDWYKSWLVISGILTLLVSGYYLLSAIWFLQLRRKSIVMIYIAFVLSIILGTTKAIVTTKALGSLALMMMSGGIVAVVVELVLLIVVFSSDKACFDR